MHLAKLARFGLALATAGIASSCGDSGSGGEPDRLAAPALSTPADGAVDLDVGVQLCWEAVEHPGSASVRYRVRIDGEVLDEDGVPDTCIAVPSLEYDRTYAWTVEAFEPAHPDQGSASETWMFATTWDPVGGKVLFEDDFLTDRGWNVFGDASDGSWSRGTPDGVVHDEGQELAVSQPDGCRRDDSFCYFTATNPGGDSADGDVDGSTVLLSPPFDISGAARLEIELTRFFYRTTFEHTGSALSIDLLVPDPGQPSGRRTYALERLVNADDAQAANEWTPISFTACDILFAPGAQLRVSAIDHGDEIVEAALDEVVVTGFKEPQGCPSGVGALCDPDIAGACGDELLCCALGTLNDGYFRCSEPVRGLDFDDPPADPDAVPTGELGCDAPDLILIDEFWDEPMRVFVDDLYVPPNACSIEEGCVDGTGWRRVLRFDTITANVGSRDLDMGLPPEHPGLFLYSECHDHFHFNDYARYALLDDEARVVGGHKQAFCLLDLGSWAWPTSFDFEYTCENQGISLGWADAYGAELDCQWIDITDLAAGEYTLRIEVNYPRSKGGLPTLVERDYSNNVLEVPVSIP